MAPQRGRGRSRAEVWPVPVGPAVPAVATAGGLPGALHWTAWGGQLVALVRAEAGPGRLLPWVPVAFGAGIALYFSADHEPVLWIAAMAAMGAGIAGVLLRRSRAFAPQVLLAAFAAGFATATWKTARIAHPVLSRPTSAVSLKGFVETYEVRERTDRFVLRVTEMETPRHEPTLTRVRLSVRKGTGPAVGSFVELKARLSPPITPLRPGSYDFARDLYFQGIGASGFVMGAVTVAQAPPQGGGLWLRYAAALQGMRDAIDARIRATLSGDSRAIATALLTGRRDAITTPVNDAMFISGLGHVLSISGYHMAVVAGAVFAIVRALLALIPPLATRYPIKKWAAAAALAGAAFYLVLSGSEVATQRSFLMTAVVLIAIMVDRRAITFRTLAIAAMVVLVIAPEALVHPSFQMSFAATLGLVALVAHGMPRLFATPDNSRVARLALWGGREAVVLLLASLVAGLATTPYAAFHFHRITPYGVLANLAAMPVVSGLVMPAGLLGLVAMPFGLDGIFWSLMDAGIAWMVIVAQWVTALPGAVGRMPAFGAGPLLLASAGMLVLAMCRTLLRWSGLAVVVVATVWALMTPQPDVLVSSDGQNVAVRGRDGRLHMMRLGKDAFLLKEWLAADGDARTPADGSLGEGVSCDVTGCIAGLPDGALVALSIRPDGWADDCAKAILMITRGRPPPSCAAQVIDQARVRRFGAMALRRVDGIFVVDAQKPKGRDRPWSPAMPGDEDALSPAGSGRGPVDATPVEADRLGDD
ncbi:ComEC family competence protein [Bradyrhizobium sp. U87765 SZCCT0131]|uniref:ComEC/Rec2 family competence protein n=1 Tax=unclassified Bradyrhizobium TaxID=2631580 RepID=UPI001BADF0FD|nr:MULTISPECIES: ComEC/Rec2 family competence protein [unclassified Bradyrhizobium]MBR1220052.1 ComEC family competence protein [Bradyrhizobium sp. U87765 SZCCT0131]MBR1263492.1 ComEC family competence protein [Bradyrhizobium sp. U87765 SZCCT0134]MBR1309061.1 ComEC family competence protein [Bradyrhizobium sp. U87765 SZCCT0110]MBR1323824.1 ComEC family competence protein [Bradyrhizobium sp. U87765 SZCCT0109]MBR1349376.1 ComEC family competence protein [Bradyrhizobium sp. U87765 SZCCT0048]